MSFFKAVFLRTTPENAAVAVDPNNCAVDPTTKKRAGWLGKACRCCSGAPADDSPKGALIRTQQQDQPMGVATGHRVVPLSSLSGVSPGKLMWTPPHIPPSKSDRASRVTEPPARIQRAMQLSFRPPPPLLRAPPTYFVDPDPTPDLVGVDPGCRAGRLSRPLSQVEV